MAWGIQFCRKELAYPEAIHEFVLKDNKTNPNKAIHLGLCYLEYHVPACLVTASMGYGQLMEIKKRMVTFLQGPQWHHKMTEYI